MATTDCDWHMHSLFRPCANGLTIGQYLSTASTTAPCPDREVRSAMGDDDFWAHVLLGEQPEYFEPDEADLDQTTRQNEPCRECGERGPCGYDMEGRPMIHITSEDEEPE